MSSQIVLLGETTFQLWKPAAASQNAAPHARRAGQSNVDVLGHNKRDRGHGTQVTSAKQLRTSLEEAGKELVPLLGGNLVDEVWGAARPDPPKEPLRVHPLEFAGEAPADKIARLRKDMASARCSRRCWSSYFQAAAFRAESGGFVTRQAEGVPIEFPQPGDLRGLHHLTKPRACEGVVKPRKRFRVSSPLLLYMSNGLRFRVSARPSAEAKAGALLVTALDEVAWLLNLRGNDISYNPVFVSYALLTADQATLYVDQAKVRPLLPAVRVTLPWNLCASRLSLSLKVARAQPRRAGNVLQKWLWQGFAGPLMLWQSVL